MKSQSIERVYLGTWFQRTALHLLEVFYFLKNTTANALLDPQQVKALQKSLKISAVEFNEESVIDFVKFTSGNIETTITEDGVILMSLPATSLQKSIERLELFYSNQLAPALMYLFSKGAPLPKELADVKTIHPHILVGSNISQETILSIFKTYQDQEISSVQNQQVHMSFGSVMSFLNRKKKSFLFSQTATETLVQNIIFSREFEQQLSSYLNLHRSIWDKVSEIREAQGIRYKDFPQMRQQILGFLKTISFVQARLLQMEDILHSRKELIDPKMRTLLSDLGINNFEQFHSGQSYISHLWQMTKEYAQDSLNLMESLYQENAQRELNALKFITLIAALTGFFGMNIAFPWDETWEKLFPSSLAVVLIIFVACLGFYYLLRRLIHYRKFVIKNK